MEIEFSSAWITAWSIAGLKMCTLGPNGAVLGVAAAALTPPVATNAAASSAAVIPAGNSRLGIIVFISSAKRSAAALRDPALGHRTTTSADTLRSRDDRPARIVY